MVFRYRKGNFEDGYRLPETYKKALGYSSSDDSSILHYEQVTYEAGGQKLAEYIQHVQIYIFLQPVKLISMAVLDAYVMIHFQFMVFACTHIMAMTRASARQLSGSTLIQMA